MMITEGSSWSVCCVNLHEYWIGTAHRVVIAVGPRAAATFNVPEGFVERPTSDDGFLSDVTYYSGPYESLPDELRCEAPLLVASAEQERRA